MKTAAFLFSLLSAAVALALGATPRKSDLNAGVKLGQGRE